MSLPQLFNRRHLVYLALLAAGIFLLLPRLIGFDHVVRRLQSADPVFLGLALGVEVLRYVMSGASTVVLARLFARRVPLLPMIEAFFAGSALNRVFSTGGAPGMIVRFVFLTKHQLAAGAVAAIFLIEDIIGLAIGSIVFLIGMVTFSTAGVDGFVTRLAVGFMLGSLALVLTSLYVLHKRASVERIIHALARRGDAISRRFLRRAFYDFDRVQHTLDDFYTGLRVAQRAPGLVAAAFLFNVLRYAAGALALYFAFHAVNQPIAPGVLITLYTAASVLSTTSALPGEMAIMGAGFAVLLLAVGLAPDVAFAALILSRAIAFWLPMPIGYAMLWHLQRRSYL